MYSNPNLIFIDVRTTNSFSRSQEGGVAVIIRDFYPECIVIVIYISQDLIAVCVVDALSE